MTVVVDSYRSVVAFRPERFNPVPVAESERARVLLVCLEPGQFIPIHRPGVDFAIVVLEGKGRLVAGDKEEPAAAGTIAFVPAGAARGIKATTRFVAVTVVTPLPTDADHAGVMAGLRKGDWRGGEG